MSIVERGERRVHRL